MSNSAHRSRSRRSSSCMSSEWELIFAVAKWATTLSVSTSTERPLSCGPHRSTTRRIPKSSRQLIGRLCSARVKRSVSSSTSPPMKISWPVPHPDASVPAKIAVGRAELSPNAQR
eukprot:2809788-Prymnesium_polylepis.1